MREHLCGGSQLGAAVLQSKETATKLSTSLPLRSSAQIFKAALLYFAVIFGTGFVLGTIRVLWSVPQFGERNAELLEQPLMLVAVFLAARWIVRRAGAALASVEAFAVGPHGARTLDRGGITCSSRIARTFDLRIHSNPRSCIGIILPFDACCICAYAVASLANPTRANERESLTC